MKIFWSWQSDTHQPSGRYFVRDVLADLARNLNGVDEAEEAERPDRNEDEDEDDGQDQQDRIDIDHDTLGVGGSPRIADTILRKIEEAAVFVADVTPVGNTPGGKRLPNPNVMIELGYALRVMELERIVLVMNRAEGAALKNLPFDLRHWRAPVSYSLVRNASDDKRAEVAQQLKQDLRLVIEPGLKAAAKAFLEVKRRVQRRPELAIGLTADKVGPFQISQSVGDLGVPPLEEIRAKTPLLVVPKPNPMLGGPIIPPHIGASSIYASMGRSKPVQQWTREEKEGFNRRVKSYYSKYQTYLDAVADHIRLKNRSLLLNLVLENTGTLPATGIDVDVTFPEGVVLHNDEGELPDEPTAPEPPPLDPSGVTITRPSVEMPSLPSYLPRSTWFYPAERRVRFHIDYLKHHQQVALDEFTVSFTSQQDIRSFEAEYIITDNETVDPILGTVVFDVELLD